jgi:hypothetical protein
MKAAVFVSAWFSSLLSLSSSILPSLSTSPSSSFKSFFLFLLLFSSFLFDFTFWLLSKVFPSTMHPSSSSSPSSCPFPIIFQQAQSLKK